MHPKLSIIIPAYNVEKYIGEAICSAINQTITELEIIVVDDGSTDKTREVVRSFQKDHRVKLITQDKLGSSEARNNGINNARGEFIGFLDSDDRWAPKKSERHLEIFNSYPDVDLTFSWWKIINHEGKDLGITGTPVKSQIQLEDLVLENFFGPSSTVFVRKKIFDKIGYFDVNLEAAVDLDMWLRIVELQPNNVKIIPEILVDWRIRPGQVTGNWKRMSKNWNKVISKVKTKFPEKVSPVLKEAKFRQERYHAHLAYREKDLIGATKCFLRSFSSKPIKTIIDKKNWTAAARILRKMY